MFQVKHISHLFEYFLTPYVFLLFTLKKYMLAGLFYTFENILVLYPLKGVLLKLVSAIFYQIFIFSPNDSPLKTMKKLFSSKKLFSFSRYSNFCIFSPSFPHFPDSKGQMEVE